MGILQGELTFPEALIGLKERLPIQLEFVTSQARNAALVGGVGAAKTVALMTTCIANGLSEPRGFSLVGRLNMPALESSTMKTFLEMVPEDRGDWQESKKKFVFHNGHEVIFKHLDITDPKIVGHIRSMNLSSAYIDEASEISEEVFLLLLSRLRRKNCRHCFRLTSNPAGHNWIWKHFYDKKRKEAWQSNVGLVVTTLDNPFLSEEFKQSLINTYPEDWAQRFIYGSFNELSDLIFKEFSEDMHVWDARKKWPIFGGRPDPPLDWPIIAGIDIGSDIDPWAILFIAVSPDGRLFEYGEVYAKNMLISDIAGQMKPFLEGRPSPDIAYDYANRQCALELCEHGIFGQAAIKEVKPGLLKTVEYFTPDDRLEHPFDPTSAVSPRYFISSFNFNSIRELGEYKWAKDRTGASIEDPSHESSHSPDARRYAVHTFRPLPEREKVVRLWENDSLDTVSKMYWRDEDKKRDKMERFKPFSRVDKTIKQWQKIAGSPPMRFQRFTGFRRSVK